MTDAIVKFEDTMNIAKAMAASGFFQDSADASKAVVKILAGQEIGIGPFASMTGIHIIKGKPVMGANIVATIIANDPRYDYKVTGHDDKGCVIEFFEYGKHTGTSSFLEADAKAAGLFGKDNWKKFPRNMYFARAISNGARWYTPGVFGGAPVYTPDEFDLDVDEDGGVVIEGVATKVTEPQPDLAERDEEIIAEAAVKPKKANGKARSWDGALVQALVKADMAQHPQHAVGMLNLSNLPPDATVEQVVAWGRIYRGQRDADVSSEDAVKLANGS